VGDDRQPPGPGLRVRDRWGGDDPADLRPNWPDRDDVSITVDAAGIRQSTGEVLFGLLLLD
jgi:hypothetical protein